VIEIEIPLPPQGVQQNQRRHWRETAAAIRGYRLMCRGAAANAGKVPVPVKIHAEFFMGRSAQEKTWAQARRARGLKPKPIVYRPLDTMNAIAALKAAIDGIVDAGVLPGDSHKQVQWGDVNLYRTAKEHKGRSCVVLRLEPLSNGYQEGR